MVNSSKYFAYNICKIFQPNLTNLVVNENRAVNREELLVFTLEENSRVSAQEAVDVEL